ncbi:MAG: hypothetical protein J6S23_02170 [Clostridia bacterium]|nr:hypothetical protein [Clostridia bacterium]
MKVVLISIAVFLALILVAVGGFKLYDYIGAAEFYNNSEKVFKTPGVNDSNFVPQGMTYDEESNTYFFTGYMGKPILGKLGDDVASRVYVRNANGEVTFTRLLNADGTPYTDHTGGVEFFGDYVYVTGEDSHGLDVFSAADILAGKAETKMLGTVKTYNSPAHCYTFSDEQGQRYILAGSYHKDETVYLTPEHEKIAIPETDKTNTSVMTVFKLDANAQFGVQPEPVAIISAREMIQGICMTPEGQLVISSSWGLATSNLYFYNMSDFTCVEDYNYKGTIAYGDLEDVNAEKTYEEFNFTVPCYIIDSHDPEKTVVAPPMSEELVCRDGMIIVFCESACNKYMFGKLTTGFNTYGYKYN